MSQTNSGTPIMWHYYQPSVTDMLPKSAPTDGLDPLTHAPLVVEVWGANFGVERDVFFGGERKHELPGGNHSYLSFVMGQGQGIRNLVRTLQREECVRVNARMRGL